MSTLSVTQGPGNAQATILFVDDEPRILNTMRMLFRNTYNLLFANGGAEAIAILKSQRVDVVVSDQRMPEVTGIEVLRCARENQPDAMRILLTGYSDLNAVLGSINEGEVFRFINKPWINEQLTQTIAQAVEAARNSAGLSQDTLPSVDLTAGVLVLDPDSAVHEAVREAMGDGMPVFGATSISQALDLLGQHRIGVIVCETLVDNEPIVRFLGTLKEHHPELVSVILTERADANYAISLINQGQIYRLVLKPIRSAMCKMSVLAALKQHERLNTVPKVTQRYAVEVQQEPVEASRTPGWLDRIRGMKLKTR